MSEGQANVDETVVEAAEKPEVDTVDPKEYADLKAEVAAIKAEAATLREHNAQVIADRKAKAKEADKRLLAEKEKKALDNEDYKELLALKDNDYKSKEGEYRTQLEELTSKLAARDEADKQRQVNNEAMKIATDLSKTSVKKAETLANILKTRLKLTEDGIKVVDGKGKFISGDMAVLKEFAKTEYDFLCDGLQSTGGAGVFKSTDNAQDNSKLNPIDRINRDRGLY